MDSTNLKVKRATSTNTTTTTVDDLDRPTAPATASVAADGAATASTAATTATGIGGTHQTLKKALSELDLRHVRVGRKLLPLAIIDSSGESGESMPPSPPPTLSSTLNFSEQQNFNYVQCQSRRRQRHAPALTPPISRDSLRELELDHVLRNPQLRERSFTSFNFCFISFCFNVFNCCHREVTQP